jgi:hypothetical protein
MKKMYLLLAALFGLFFSTNAFAQDINLEDQFEWDKLSRDGYTVDKENPLITDPEQFSSPFSQNDLGSPDGGNLSDGVLLDGKYDTFWHSVWRGGSVDGGTHYLQVEMPDDFDEETLIAFIYARRTNADNDHTTEWCVMGTDDPEAEKDECEELAYITTPFSSKTDVCMSTPFKTGGYMYLRFYSEKETGTGDYGTRGYFHIGDFNIYPVVKIEDNKAAWIELEAAYNKYQAYQDTYMDCLGDNPGQYSEEAYDAFMKALDAYGAIDPDNDSAEKMNEVRDLIIQTAEAIAPTKVPFLSKDMPAGSGYYRIRAGMEYSTDDKYMMGYRNEGKIWGIWGTPDFDELTDNIQALWKIEIKSDSTYDIVNMYNDGRFMKVARSTHVEMTTDPAYADTLMAFDAAGYDIDYERAYVNIRWATQPANDFFYLHQEGHSNGGGNNGYLVGWATSYSAPTCGGSEWFFEEVPADEAKQIIEDFEPYKNRDVWVDEFKMMMKAAPDMIEVAKDVAQINLLTKASQFSSPYSQNDLGSADGGNLSDGVLIDGKTNTYWHSVWSVRDGEEYPDGKHYLQVEMPEGFDAAQQIYMRFTRRDTNNNQITNWSFKGTNEFDAEEDDCEELATFESPWNSSNQTESFKSDYFDTKGYKYIRFYNEQNNAGSAFFHLSEIQLCYDVENPQSQYIAMGEVATTLEKLVEDFSDIEPDDLDYETNYLVLQKAYNDFVALYVNPKALRDTIALAEVSVEQVVEGTDPGFWPAGTATNLTKLIADAKAYDKAGAYTPAKSDEFNAQLNAQMKAIDSAPLKIKTGKWYRLRFGTEAEYDKYGWSKTGNFPNYEIDNTDPEDPDTLGMYNAGNFGKYIAVAKRVEVPFEKADGTETTGNLIEPIAKEDIIIDKSIFGIDLEKLTDPDMALWRFVSVGDSAYAIQNKATGLYIHSGIYLSAQPGLFTQHPSGYGQNAFFNKSIEGNGKSPMHLAQSQTVLCAWGNESGSGWTDADGRRGSFFVEEVADVAADYSTGGEYKMSLTPGDIYGRCYPVPVTLKTPDLATLWTIASIERTPDAADEAVEQVSVTLAKIDNAVPAGRPFIIVAAGEMPEEGDEYEPVKPEFSFTFDLVNAPQTKNYLKGAFDSKTIDVKFMAIGSGHEENALAFKNSGSTTGDNRVYITDIEEGNEGFLRKAKIVEIAWDGTDNISTVLQKVSRVGGIFTIDGRRIGNGNLNTISNLPKGAYILNGQKVIVK